METFTQLDNSPLYHLADGDERSVYFLLNTDNPLNRGDTPSEIPAADTWQARPGYYLFVNVFDADEEQFNPEQFSGELLAYLRHAGVSSGIVWAEAQVQPYHSHLTVRVIELSPSITTLSQAATRSTLSWHLVNWRNYYLAFRSGLQVTLDIDTNALHLHQPPAGRDIFMRVGKWGERQFVVGPEVTIPLLGEKAGTLQFHMRLNRDLVDQFGAGLRFAWPHDKRRYSTIHAPIFDLPPPRPLQLGPSETLELQACLDPFQAGVAAPNRPDPARTHFSLFKAGASPARIPSFLTDPDEPLIPQEKASLVFTAHPYDRQQPGKHDAYYLAPSGTFQGVYEGEERTLEFVPHQKAFAPYYTPGAEPPATQLEKARTAYMDEESEFETSWLRLQGKDPMPGIIPHEALPNYDQLAEYDQQVLDGQRRLLQGDDSYAYDPGQYEVDEEELVTDETEADSDDEAGGEETVPADTVDEEVRLPDEGEEPVEESESDSPLEEELEPKDLTGEARARQQLIAAEGWREPEADFRLGGRSPNLIKETETGGLHVAEVGSLLQKGIPDAASRKRLKDMLVAEELETLTFIDKDDLKRRISYQPGDDVETKQEPGQD